jgi:hypothetical protein
VSEGIPASAAITATRVDDVSRAGLGSFGATLSIASARVRCAGIEIVGEDHASMSTAFEDRGDNLCGCPFAETPCKLTSAGLAPPGALDPIP